MNYTGLFYRSGKADVQRLISGAGTDPLRKVGLPLAERWLVRGLDILYPQMDAD